MLPSQYSTADTETESLMLMRQIFVDKDSPLRPLLGHNIVDLGSLLKGFLKKENDGLSTFFGAKGVAVITKRSH